MKKSLLALAMSILAVFVFARCTSFAGKADSSDPVLYSNKSSASEAYSSSAVAEIEFGSFIDERDGESGRAYKTVKIGSKTWMAENLNYKLGGSKCYGDDEGNCEKYGRLYSWSAAMQACPSGWRLPGNAEWDALYRLIDSNYGIDEESYSLTAGKHLKAKSGWNDSGEDAVPGNGTDGYGFAALPGGCGCYPEDKFYGIGSNGSWWSASEIDASNAYNRNMNYFYDTAAYGPANKTTLHSVRCLQD